MQLMKDFFQVGGSLNGITWTGNDASYDDCNTYILKTDEGLIMFDCGCGDTLEQIFNNMLYWDLNPEDIKACFITHPHLDHAGACHLLAD
ncbi:MAG TPA: MBL fold metallo-hydrolase, partial [bacterium]|nr:MBL fold metallo-hydrolase [bacterium]